MNTTASWNITIYNDIDEETLFNVELSHLTDNRSTYRVSIGANTDPVERQSAVTAMMW